MTLMLDCVLRNRIGFGLDIPVVLCRGQDLEQQSGPVRKTGEELVQSKSSILSIARQKPSNVSITQQILSLEWKGPH